MVSIESIELQSQSRVRGTDAPQLPVYELEREFQHPDESVISLSSLSPVDRFNFYFLTLLYFAQGIPVGLAMGSVPFLLKERLTYGQIGMFSLASYPYSLKLLWSPIVDGIFFKKFGRRKSWIVPIQLFSALVLLFLSTRINDLMDNAADSLRAITIMFGVLVTGCATQDIAVDGWALTLLSQSALPYASTAQTIGMNTGYFTSFTVFLALSSPEFANKFVRTVPDPENGLISLSGYLFFCALVFFAATAAVMLGKSADSVHEDSLDESVSRIYQSMVGVLRLPAMQSLLVLHLVAKIAFQAAEAVTNLKLIEKGLSKEDLALVVLIDFPFEIVFGYYAAKWSTGPHPLNSWLWAYVLRLVFAFISMSQVYFFPSKGVSMGYLSYIVLVHVLGSFLSTVQFVSITAFHTRIADANIGGTYMTVLNTLLNLGGQWPRALVLIGVDWFTTATCDATGNDCVTMRAKQECELAGGHCVVHRDGYYLMNTVCIIIGILLFKGFIRRTAEKLQSLPPSMWKRKRALN
nr:ST.15 [Starmerella bombicola]